MWKLFDPARGTIWMGAWAGQVRTTFHEPFARHWLAQMQSQNVIPGSPNSGYAEAAD